MEGFLLVIFAVALENLFVQMLGFPGGFGQALKRRNKWLWLAALTAVTFLFYHTLINPRGELAEALETGNVRLFLSMAALFVVVAFGVRDYFKWQERRAAGPSKVTPAPVPTATKSDDPTACAASNSTCSCQSSPKVPSRLRLYPSPRSGLSQPRSSCQPRSNSSHDRFHQRNESVPCLLQSDQG